MTKMEKHIIFIALKEYIERHKDELVNVSMAKAILSYWKNIENATAGSIKI